MDIALVAGISPLAATAGFTALVLARILDGDDLIFNQTRHGDTRTFKVRKITSMRESDDQDTHNGRRVTPLGGILRPLAIDELPQLINIAQGTMSAVGPRAQTESVRANMEAALDRNTHDEWLHAVETSRAGGLSSFGISIRRPEFTERTYLAKARMDIADFNKASFAHDLQIIRGAVAVARKRLIPVLREQLPQLTGARDTAGVRALPEKALTDLTQVESSANLTSLGIL
jgi:lipopolysaccharide/colanic/teichoic acid biosynthesis glycosyltransferase